MMKRRLFTYFLLSLLTFIAIHSNPSTFSVNAQVQQSEKDSLFQQFSEKRKGDPKEAYRVAQQYLQKYGTGTDENTKIVKD